MGIYGKRIIALLAVIIVVITGITGCAIYDYSESLIKSQSIYITVVISMLLTALVVIAILSINIDKKRRVIVRQSQDLQLSLDSMTGILNKSDIMIYVADAVTSKMLFINDKMNQHFGLDESALGKPCYEVFKRGAAMCQNCPRHQLNKEPDKVVIWEDYDGAINRYYRKINHYADWPGNIKVNIQYCVDITDIKKIQTELEFQKNTLQTMINSMPDFVFGKNLNSEYTLLNHSAAKYLNVDVDNVIGKNDVDGIKFSAEVSKLMVLQDKRIFDGEPKLVDEHWIPAYDGTERYFETTKAPIIQEGAIIGLVGTSRDITEKMQMEKKLEAALEEVTNAKIIV